jgi:hypothetical protein
MGTEKGGGGMKIKPGQVWMSRHNGFIIIVLAVFTGSDGVLVDLGDGQTFWRCAEIQDHFGYVGEL